MEPPAVVVPYDPAWPAAFRAIRAFLAPHVPDCAAVEHVGSTAVPGLDAKPIVDVDVVVPSTADVDDTVAALVAAGYEHRGDLGIAGREAFAMPRASGLAYHHLYVVVAGSPPHRDHVDLRDYLRTHPDDAARYAAEKQRHAALLATDREAYTDAKGELVAELLAKARGPLSDDDVRRLVDALDDESTEVAEDAQAELTSLGLRGAEAVTRRLGELGTFGTLCAIDVVSDVGYADAAPALVPLLRHEDGVVREWAARELGTFGYRPAVPELWALARRLRDEGEALAWTGPVTVRQALIDLGARVPVVPPLVRELAEPSGAGTCWPAAALERLVDALADASQAVLYFQVWQRSPRGRYWRQHASLGWDLDPAKPWEVSVREAREAALIEASDLPENRDALVVTIEWLDAADLDPRPTLESRGDG